MKRRSLKYQDSQSDTQAGENSNKIDKVTFLEIVEKANDACQKGQFEKAIELYTQSISLDQKNHVLYGNRSAACIRTKQFQLALSDGQKAAELYPEWSKAFYRQGVAMQCMGRHVEAMATFATALSKDGRSLQLLQALVDASMKSTLKSSLEPMFNQMVQMGIDKDPFVVIATIGQELLTIQETTAAIDVLEAALKIGTDNAALCGSVFSALSSAYWRLNKIPQAITSMNQDLELSESTGDLPGQYRVHGNLGNTYHSINMFNEAIEHYQIEYDIATTLNDQHGIAHALSSLGHVSVAVNDYENALLYHQKCANVRREAGQQLLEARELGCVGSVHLLMGDYVSAGNYHNRHLEISRHQRDTKEQCRALCDLGSLKQVTRDFDGALRHYLEALDLSHKTKDAGTESRALAGLGHAYRSDGNLIEAIRCHRRQLEIAISQKDRPGEGRARSNLGIALQEKGQFTPALANHKVHLTICQELDDKDGQCRAYGNIGNAYHSLGQFEQAIKCHQAGLEIAKQLDSDSNELVVHGNLAVAYQALGKMQEALEHYEQHKELAIKLKDLSAECLAHSNLGNFHSSQKNFQKSVIHYQNQLEAAQKHSDEKEVCKASHNLAFAFYSLGDYHSAIENYNENITVAEKYKDRTMLASAYCNLGLAYAAIDRYSKAVACQKQFLTLSIEKSNRFNVCKALCNLGEIYMSIGDWNEALKYHSEQMKVAEKSQVRLLLAGAFRSLGRCYEKAGEYKEALDLTEKELIMRKDLNNHAGVSQCLQSLGALHERLGNREEALRCYKHDIEVAEEAHDWPVIASAYGNMGLTLANAGHLDDASDYFEKQLNCLHQLKDSLLIAHAHCQIAETCLSFSLAVKAVKHLREYLTLVRTLHNIEEEDNAQLNLAKAYLSLGDYAAALVCHEERLVLANELPQHKSLAAYQDLGRLHIQLNNYDQAFSCFENLTEKGCESGDVIAQLNGYDGLGEICCLRQRYDDALRYHDKQLELADRQHNEEIKAIALLRLGTTFYAMEHFDRALVSLEQCLNIESNSIKIEAEANDLLGKVHYCLQSYSNATTYYLQAISKIDNNSLNDIEVIKIRFRLGLCYYNQGNLMAAKQSFCRAIEMWENYQSNSSASRLSDSDVYLICLASYQMLQRLAIGGDFLIDALYYAECVTTLQHWKLRTTDPYSVQRPAPPALTPRHNIDDLTNDVTSTTLVYSLAIGRIYTWLLENGEGVAHFTETAFIDDYATEENLIQHKPDDIWRYCITKQDDAMEHYVIQLRESLGIARHTTSLERCQSFECDIADLVDQSVNFKSRIGLPAKVWSSIPKTGYEFIPKPRKRHVSVVNDPNWESKAPLRYVYDLLITPIESCLPEMGADVLPEELSLVLPAQLILIPFHLLKREKHNLYLSERYQMRILPSLYYVKYNIKMHKNNKRHTGDKPSLCVGKKRNSSCELAAVENVLDCVTVAGSTASKSFVKEKLTIADICHFATEVNWKQSSLVLSSPDLTNGIELGTSPDPEIEDLEPDNRLNPTSHPDVTLSISDILKSDLNCKLVAFGVGQSLDSTSISLEGLINLSTSFLQAGASSVLTSLWPVRDAACKEFLTSFYKGLNNGLWSIDALQQTISRMQNNPEFNHPANWAGFLLIGNNIKLEKKILTLTDILHVLLEKPNRNAIKVLLHLVELSRQRIAQGQRSAMYTAESSIKAKVGDIYGWKELLIHVGFSFKKSNNGLPDCALYPTAAHNDVLNKCSNTLYAFLGLSEKGLEAMSKLHTTSSAAGPLIGLLREVIDCFSQEQSNVQFPLDTTTWKISGCHEFLSALGFNVMGASGNTVILRSGKSSMRRPLQCAMQVIIDVFEFEGDASDFMCNVSSKTSSEVHLRDSPHKSKTNEDTSRNASNVYPMRKARSTPIKGSRREETLRRLRGESDTNNRNNDTLPIDERLCVESNNSKPPSKSQSQVTQPNPYLSKKVGLFSGKDLSNSSIHSEQGASIRRLRTRSSNPSIANVEERAVAVSSLPDLSVHQEESVPMTSQLYQSATKVVNDGDGSFKPNNLVSGNRHRMHDPEYIEELKDDDKKSRRHSRASKFFSLLKRNSVKNDKRTTHAFEGEMKPKIPVNNQQSFEAVGIENFDTKDLNVSPIPSGNETPSSSIVSLPLNSNLKKHHNRSSKFQRNSVTFKFNHNDDETSFSRHSLPSESDNEDEKRIPESIINSIAKIDIVTDEKPSISQSISNKDDLKYKVKNVNTNLSNHSPLHRIKSLENGQRRKHDIFAKNTTRPLSLNLRNLTSPINGNESPKERRNGTTQRYSPDFLDTSLSHASLC